MDPKHRRVPSAMPFSGFAPKDEAFISFTSTLTFDPPNFLTNSTRSPYHLLSPPKNPPIFHSPKKFPNNYCMSSDNEFCSFLSSSGENFIHEINNIQAKHKEKPLKTGLDPLKELKKVVTQISENKKKARIKVENERKLVKSELCKLFNFIESDIDTERRIESLRCSGDTVQGPGSFYRADDPSLVKFEPSVEYKKKARPKSVKFNI